MVENAPQIIVPPPEIDVDTKESKLETPPPLFAFSITNPVTYLQAWWKKIIGNDGVKVTIQVKPLTAIALVSVFAGVGFGFGRITLPEPIIQYLPITTPKPSPSPTPSPLRFTAFSGKLQVSGERYFLLTTSSEAITLIVPSYINLKPLVGKRVMAVGAYNQSTKTMEISDSKSLEVLTASPVPIPTIKPSNNDAPHGASPSPSPSGL